MEHAGELRDIEDLAELLLHQVEHAGELLDIEDLAELLLHHVDSEDLAELPHRHRVVGSLA